MIICLEGPSAVGKTTTCALLEAQGAYIVKEANELFERPRDASATWYFERQVERYRIARKREADHPLVVLDGDVFQPFSYNWCYDFEVFGQSLDLTSSFFEHAVAEGRIGFPDRYFYLLSDEQTLRARKENDETRRRGNFESHLRMLGPHERYYAMLNELAPGMTQSFEARSAAENAGQIAAHLSSVSRPSDSELLMRIVCWLRANEASASRR